MASKVKKSAKKVTKVKSVKKPAAKKSKVATSKVTKKKVVSKTVSKASSKPAARKSAPVKAVVKQPVKTVAKIVAMPTKPMAKPMMRMGKAPIVKPTITMPTPVKTSTVGYDKGVKVVYPAHGVGEIIGIETHLVAGMELKQYVIQFEKEKMVLRVPVARAEKSGLRMLSSDDDLKSVRRTLLERPKSSRGMWSRRAKEYETKINSGNIIAVAEVVRDLHKNVDDPERSYSERVIYENALERLAREVSAIKSLDILSSSDYVVKTINDNNPYFIKRAAAKKAAQEAEDMAA